MTTTPHQGVIDALACIRSAEAALDDLLATTAGSARLNALSSIYTQLHAVAALLIQAQLAADDSIFEHATASLKAQTAALKASEDALKKIVADIGLAGKIIGYIVQAGALITAL
jgi:hypothetical protein